MSTTGNGRATGVPKNEYKLIPLNVRSAPSDWERQINEAADEGFEWIDAFPGPRVTPTS